MTSSEYNAPLNPPDRRRPRPSLARLLAPLQAAVRHHADRFVLQLEPMSAIDAFSAWSRLAESEEGASPGTLLVRAPRPIRRATQSAESVDQTPLSSLAQRVGVRVQETFAPDALLLCDQDARELIAFGAVHDVVAVRIEGPVEASDATAILDALGAGQSPLAVELRAVAVMEVSAGTTVVLSSRHYDDILCFVAESLRQYLASVRNVAVTTLAAPEPGLVHALLGRSGRITVRPLETEIYSTSIDVGVSTDGRGELRPADQSLIYDIHSNTWHGE